MNTTTDNAQGLRDIERKALEGLMHNALHEATRANVDVDDHPPSIDEDEDAYWAFHNYNALSKALATQEVVGGKTADSPPQQEREQADRLIVAADGKSAPTSAFVELGIGYARNYVACRRPSLSETAKEYIEGLCDLLEQVQAARARLAAPAAPATPESERSEQKERSDASAEPVAMGFVPGRPFFFAELQGSGWVVVSNTENAPHFWFNFGFFDRAEWCAKEFAAELSRFHAATHPTPAASDGINGETK